MHFKDLQSIFARLCAALILTLHCKWWCFLPYIQSCRFHDPKAVVFEMSRKLGLPSWSFLCLAVSVLHSTTPVLLCTTKYYSVLHSIGVSTLANSWFYDTTECRMRCVSVIKLIFPGGCLDLGVVLSFSFPTLRGEW